MEASDDWFIEDRISNKISKQIEVNGYSTEAYLEIISMNPNLDQKNYLKKYEESRKLYSLHSRVCKNIGILLLIEFDIDFEIQKIKRIFFEIINISNPSNSFEIDLVKDLEYKIPEIKNFRGMSDFYVNYNNQDSSYLLNFYIKGRFYLIRVKDKIFEKVYEKQLNPNQGKTLLTDFFYDKQKSIAFLYHNSNLMTFTYNYYKNTVIYEEKAFNLISAKIPEKIKSLHILNDKKNALIITISNSIFLYDAEKYELKKIENGKNSIKNIFFIKSDPNFLKNSSTSKSEKYFFSDSIVEDKRRYLSLKLWKLNLKDQSSDFIKEFIQEIQIPLGDEKNKDFYNIKIIETNVFVYLSELDLFYIFSLNSFEGNIIVDKAFEGKIEDSLKNSDFVLIDKTDNSSELKFYILFGNEFYSVDFVRNENSKILKFEKPQIEPELDPDNSKFEKDVKKEGKKKKDSLKQPKIEASIQKINPNFSVPENEKKIEQNKNQTEEKKISRFNEQQINQSILQVTENKDKTKSNQKTKKDKKKGNDNQVPHTNSLNSLDSSPPEINILKENNESIKIPNNAQSGNMNNLKEDINQIIERNLNKFSENILKKIDKTLSVINSESHNLEKIRGENIKLLEKISLALSREKEPEIKKVFSQINPNIQNQNFAPQVPPNQSNFGVFQTSVPNYHQIPNNGINLNNYSNNPMLNEFNFHFMNMMNNMKHLNHIIPHFFPQGNQMNYVIPPNNQFQFANFPNNSNQPLQFNNNISGGSLQNKNNLNSFDPNKLKKNLKKADEVVEKCIENVEDDGYYSDMTDGNGKELNDNSFIRLSKAARRVRRQGNKKK